MVDVIGHLGMALIWLAAAWFVFDRTSTAATFVLVGAVFGLFPDVDLYLAQWLPGVQHHGVVHTVLAVTLFALVAGPILGLALERWLGDSRWFSPDTTSAAAAVGFAMVWIPGLSHLFADMLSAPDVAQAIEPLWPLYRQSFGIDVVWYNNPWFNRGLLLTGLLLNFVLYLVARRSGEATTSGVATR